MQWHGLLQWLCVAVAVQFAKKCKTFRLIHFKKQTESPFEIPDEAQAL